MSSTMVVALAACFIDVYPAVVIAASGKSGVSAHKPQPTSSCWGFLKCLGNTLPK
ncbi:hypothetical protein [Vreelandella salicampi]|uniref:Uncharacterized protein n=1 Tax=Vreelandella salicampi TaxID=1449798 RepID=A0A7Z0RTR3_9GAMM|nr:hypothetical protein [Halomonas salicampi]NYS59738.1 hypothetical protein [Halomonas salicampi]